MKAINHVNNVLKKFGYIAIPIELWEQLKNELASLNDAIKVYESKEDKNA